MTWPSLPLDPWKPTRDTVHLAVTRFPGAARRAIPAT
jgi:hypothetical protein